MAHSTRPTLPPLHSLGLPRGDITLPRIHELYDPNDPRHRPIKQLHLPSTQPDQRHQLPPITSPTASQEPSPLDPCLFPHMNTPASTSTSTMPFPTRKIRLVPTSFENADAVVVIPPPTPSNTPPSHPLLFVGPALQRLRLRQRPVAEGSRLRSYRIARGPSDRRSGTEPLFPTGA